MFASLVHKPYWREYMALGFSDRNGVSSKPLQYDAIFDAGLPIWRTAMWLLQIKKKGLKLFARK